MILNGLKMIGYYHQHLVSKTGFQLSHQTLNKGAVFEREKYFGASHPSGFAGGKQDCGDHGQSGNL